MKRLYLLTIAICALFVSQGSALAANLDFMLKNDTGYVITGVYISPHSQHSWGGNVLSDPIRDGEVRTFNAPPGATNRYWDLKVTYSDGSTAEWQQGFNLARIYSMTLYYDAEGIAQVYYTFI